LLETTGLNKILSITSKNTNVKTKINSGKSIEIDLKTAPYENSYVLVSGLPVSDTNKNMLIALINTKLGTINYLPYNYNT